VKASSEYSFSNGQTLNITNINVFDKVQSEYYSIDDSYIDSLLSYGQHIGNVSLISMLMIMFVPFFYLAKD
jgi:hypothetical protein